MGKESIKRGLKAAISHDPKPYDHFFETAWHDLSEDEQQKRIKDIVDFLTDGLTDH